MSPRSRIPSGRIFFEPPKRRHVIAFFISEDVPRKRPAAETLSTHTKTSKDTRCDALRKPLVEAFATRHLTKVFLFFRRELYTEWVSAARSCSCWRGYFEVHQAKVRIPQCSSSATLLPGESDTLKVRTAAQHTDLADWNVE